MPTTSKSKKSLTLKTNPDEFRVDAEQIVFLGDVELFRHGAPHSGAWPEIAKNRVDEDQIGAEIERLVAAYAAFTEANPPVELPGKFPISWFLESPVRNGMRLSTLPWKSPEYHRALRDARYHTEILIAADCGLTEDQRIAGEQMHVVRDAQGRTLHVQADESLESIDIGIMSGAADAPEPLRKDLVRMGFFPETYMTMKRWTAVPPEILPILIAMGCHKAKSWGMLISQLSPDMLRVMALHREQFAAWPDFEPERETIREAAFALMLKIQKDPEGAKTFNSYYNAGGTTRGLVESRIDTARKLRTAIEMLDAENIRLNEAQHPIIGPRGGRNYQAVANIPSNYCPPDVATPQGVAWANANTFPTLSDLYGNCISREYQGYWKKITDGTAHVLYRPQRGQDEQGRTGGMCCFIEYTTEHERIRLYDGHQMEEWMTQPGSWYISQVSGHGNQTVNKAYREEAKNVVRQMNLDPRAYLKRFRTVVQNNAGEKDTKIVLNLETLKAAMPTSKVWEKGLSLSVIHSLGRNKESQAAVAAQPIVRRMRSAAI